LYGLNLLPDQQANQHAERDEGRGQIIQIQVLCRFFHVGFLCFRQFA
jgi:hypothetical protein